MAVFRFPSPASDSLKHLALDLDAFVTDSGVMECPEDIVDNLVDGNSRILPGVENAAEVGVSCGRRGIWDMHTYGTTYWRMVAATRPAHEFRTFVK